MTLPNGWHHQDATSTFVLNILAGISFKACSLLSYVSFQLTILYELGMDSIGNDIGTSPLSTNVAGLMINTIVNFPEDETTHVAGFNTDGWVKAKISKLTRSSDFLSTVSTFVLNSKATNFTKESIHRAGTSQGAQIWSTISPRSSVRVIPILILLDSIPTVGSRAP